VRACMPAGVLRSRSEVGTLFSILARAAPQLLSLALKMCVLPSASLLELAQGCARLRRLHLVACTTPDSLGAFLSAAHALVHLDVRQTGYLGALATELVDWVSERHESSGAPPVLSIGLDGCTSANNVARCLSLLAHEKAAEGRTMLVPTVTPVPDEVAIGSSGRSGSKARQARSSLFECALAEISAQYGCASDSR
jgi:hypothetical protein